MFNKQKPIERIEPDTPIKPLFEIPKGDKELCARNKEIFLNCIEKSLLLLADLYKDGSDMVSITVSIERLLTQRKQFIQDYFIPRIFYSKKSGEII